MSEQYPLLSSEVEEPPSPRYRRLLASKERARNHVKGAAAILVRWPRHWSTLLTYWWLGISMLALVTYIIYNTIFLHMAHSYKLHRTPMPVVQTTNISTPTKLTVPPKVLMHIFIDDKQEIDMDKYLPYIDIVTSKYRHLKFELIFVHEDIFVEMKQLDDKERNELALNNLWYDNTISQFTEHNDNLKIKHMTLSMYFYDSPMKKHWKELNPELQKFFVRALSVWQKGGIAFDPIVLTPQSPNSIYIEKIYSILQRYDQKKIKMSLKPRKQNKKLVKSSKPRKHPNNIRDIINTLNEDNITENNMSDHLMAEETRIVETNVVSNNEVYHQRKSRSPDDNYVSESEPKPNTLTETTPQNHDKHVDKRKYNLLPMFLQYLFHNKPNHLDSNTKSEITQSNTTELVPNNKSDIISTKDFWKQITQQNKEKPVLISAKRIMEKSNDDLYDNATDKVIEDFEVTIDLKGNIIATDTVCHAFIGNLFSNIMHYNDTVTVTDFIIKELSSFCKGLLASCVGIDVILL